MIEGFDIIGAEQVYWKDWENNNLSSVHRKHYSASIEQLSELYSHVLEYQALAICHLSEKQLKRAWKKMTSSDDWTKKHTDIALHSKRCKELIGIGRQEEYRGNKQIQQQQLENIHGSLQESNRIAKETSLDAKETKLISLLSSATAPYKTGKSEVAEKIDGTCEWFFNDPSFESWRDVNSSGLFWLSADPGCGKSVLSRALIDEGHLQTTTTTLNATSGTTAATESTTSTVCYFFFKDDDKLRVSSTHALCSILHQLFANDNTRKLIEHGLDSQKRSGDSFTQNLEDLWELLLKCTEHASGNIVCVLDALDECGEKSRKELLGKLKKLYARDNVRQKAKLKFFITSRPYIDLESSFKQFERYTTYLHLDGMDKGDEISQDINLVIEQRLKDLQQDRKFSHEGMQKIAERFKSMGTRTYLWLRLTMEIIEGDPIEFARVSDILHFLSTIGPDVADAYEKILNKVKASEKTATMTEKLLQILLAATRPLDLIEADYALTLAMKDDGYRSLAELKEELLWPNDFEKSAKHLCGLLIQVHDSKISFIHLTAREFLLNSPQSGMKWKGRFSDESTLHSVLAKCCIDQLVLPGVSAQRRSNQVNEDCPFVLYAASNWSHHYQIAQFTTDQEDYDTLVMKLVHTSGRYIQVWGPIYIAVRVTVRVWLDGGILNSWNGWTDLAIASYLGLLRVVERLIAQDSGCVDVSHPSFGTALNVACKPGNIDVVRTLLAHGADPNASLRNRRHSILQSALDLDSFSVAKLLIECGAHPEEADWEPFMFSQETEILDSIDRADWDRLPNSLGSVDLAIAAWPFDQGRLLKYLAEKYGGELCADDSLYKAVDCYKDEVKTQSRPADHRRASSWVTLVEFLLQKFSTKFDLKSCLEIAVNFEAEDMAKVLLKHCDGPAVIDRIMLRDSANSEEVFKLVWDNYSLKDQEKEDVLMDILEDLQYFSNDAQKTIQKVIFAIAEPLLENHTTLTKSWRNIALSTAPAAAIKNILDKTDAEFFTPDVLLSTLRNRLSTFYTIQSIFDRRDVEVTEDILYAVARKDCPSTMELCLKHYPKRHCIPFSLFRKIMQSYHDSRFSIVIYLLTGNRITETTIMDAMRKKGQDIVQHFLSQREDGTVITDRTLGRATSCGQIADVQTILTSLPPDRRISNSVLATLINYTEPQFRKEILPALFLREKGHISMTDGLWRATSGMPFESIVVLLDCCDNKFELTEPLLLRALKGGYSTESLQALLKKYGRNITITSNMLQHAASNESTGDNLTHVLLDCSPTPFKSDESIIEAALLNKNLGSVILDTIVRRTLMTVPSTDGLARLAATKGHYRQLKVLASAVHVSEGWLTLARYFEAAATSNIEDMQRLIDEGLDTDVEGNHGITALWVAAGSPFGTNATKYLIFLDSVNVNKASTLDGTSALINAVQHKNSSAALALLGAGANPNQPNHLNQTPMHHARSAEIIVALLDAGADVRVSDVNGWTCLHRICGLRGNYWLSDVFQRLMDGGLSVNSLTNEGQSVLHVLSKSWAEESALKLCLEAGADVNLQDCKGQSPLHISAKGWGHRICEFLIENGANTNLQDNDQRSPLHLAALSNGAVQPLLNAGADLDLLDKDGRTALHLAALRGNSGVLLNLYEHGASVKIRDAGGKTALDLAEESGDFDCIYFLKRMMAGKYYF